MEVLVSSSKIRCCRSVSSNAAPSFWTVAADERHYLALEQQFLDFSKALGVRPSELDAVIWWEMMGSPRSVASALEALPESKFKQRHSTLRSPTKDRTPSAREDPCKLPVLVPHPHPSHHHG